MKIKLTQAIVHELLNYEPYTGKLTHRRRARGWFKTDREWKRWNTRYANKPAFTSQVGDGYYEGGVLGHNSFAHRFIWLWMTGSWPDPQIDHKNRKPWDNRWTNLIEATQQDNCRNQSMRTDNKSGRVGVQQMKNGRWRAYIQADGKNLHLGVFSSSEEAINTRRQAEKDHGFSPGHGRVKLH